jgi:enediyne biosynthesis protein E4
MNLPAMSRSVSLLLFFTAGVLCHAPSALPQGMVSGNAKAAPRTKFSGRAFPVSLVDVAVEAGLDMTFVLGHPTKKDYVVEANGTGVAFLDYDNDDLLDIFLVNGYRLEGFANGEMPTNRLYRNAGGGKFVDTTGEANMGRFGWGNGVCGGDVDNDGNEDLYITYWGENILHRNNGDGSFEDGTARAGIGGPANEWSTGCSFLDYDRDGHLDLFVASYVDFVLDRTPKPGQFAFCMWKNTPVYCGPRGLPHGTVTLYHNRGDGTFEDVSEDSGIRFTSELYGFTATVADLNEDGWIDIYLACDSTPSLFFRNEKDGTFMELATETGIAYNEHGTEQAGMGIDIADYDNDGHLDIIKTNFIGDYPNLYRNLGEGIFDDVVLPAGLAVNPGYVVWGTGFVDLDNDGWRDVFQVTGHVYPEIEAIDQDETYKGPRLIYRNLGGGKFEDMTVRSGPAATTPHASHGAAFGDFDNDGDTDALIMNMDEPPSLLRNDLDNDHGWIKVKLQGTSSNRSAIGAVVTIHHGGRTQTATVLSQSSFLSLSDRRLHFGLGSDDVVSKITVRWPSGKLERFTGAASGELARLVEGTGQTETARLKR